MTTYDNKLTIDPTSRVRNIFKTINVEKNMNKYLKTLENVLMTRMTL